MKQNKLFEAIFDITIDDPYLTAKLKLGFKYQLTSTKVAKKI